MTDLPINQIICGDCRKIMHEWPEESVNFVMFSPPYWGLRDYGVEGQLGLEPTYQEYIAHMVEIGRGVKRVLRKDGSWYLNLGDTYAGSGSPGNQWNMYEDDTMGYCRPYKRDEKHIGIPAKCKLLMPHRVALALIDDGWICRNDIVWFKPNSMPSSVKDRPTCKTEFVFHLVKSRKYYYDLDAIRIPHKNPEGMRKYYEQSSDGQSRRFRRRETFAQVVPMDSPHRGSKDKPGRLNGYKSEPKGELLGKNPRDIIKAQSKPQNPGDFWPVTTKPFPDAHFAVYPEALCERPIKSSCPPKGIVFDPMCGSGTTLVVAKKLGRHYIGIDLNPDYCEMARRRLSKVEWPLEVFA